MNMPLIINIFLAYPEELEKPKYGFTAGMADEIHKLKNDQEFSNVEFKLHHWKISPSIGLNPDGPQGQIDSYLQESDILIFAFGHTIGKGMLHEIGVALNRPQPLQKYISCFFPQEPPQAKNSDEAQDALVFHKTREELWKIGLIGEYRSIDHLIASAAENLRKHVREFLKSKNAGRNGPTLPSNPTLIEENTKLVGREKDLGVLTDRLRFQYKRYFPILGIGGIGKTTLVRQVLRIAQTNGIIKHIVWIDLITPYTDRKRLQDFCYTQFGSSLGFEVFVKDSTQSKDKTKLILSRIRQTTEPTVVVFDNLEKIIDNNAFMREINALVTGLPSHFKIFLISQQPLDFFSFLKRVTPYNIDPLTASDSERLAKQKLRKYGTRKIEQAQIKKICDYSSGIPLLIEWMVEIALSSSNGDDALASLSGDTPETFEKSVRRMLDGLDNSARQVWDYIWVASRDRYHLRPDAINALCENTPTQPILDRLASYPLITFRRGYVTTIEALSIIQEKLHSAIPEELIHEKIAAYYLGVVSTSLKLKIESYEKTDAYREQLKDKDNFVRALEYYLEKSNTSVGPLGYRHRICLYHFAVGISWFLWINGFITERVEYLSKAIEISIKYEEEPEKCLANINDVAWTHYHLRHLRMAEQVLKHLDEPMLLIVQKSNIRYKAMIDRLKANMLIASPEPGQDPIPLLKHALAVFSDIGEHRRIASVQSELGFYHYSCKEYQQAYDAYKSSLDLAKKIGEMHSLPIYYWRVGEVLLALYKSQASEDKLDSAISYLEKGLEVSKEFRKQGEANIRTCLAEAYHLAGRSKELISEHLEVAEQIFKDIGDDARLAEVKRIRNTMHDHT